MNAARSDRGVRGERGVALMLVLWAIIVIGAVATEVVGAARRQVRQVESVRARAVARYAAESGVAAAAARLESLYRAAGTLEQRVRVLARFEAEADEWQEVTLGSARFQVAVTDVGARLDLSRSGEAVMRALIGQFVTGDEAAALTSALQDWTDRDRVARPGGAEATDYQRAGSPFVPPNEPMLRLDDLGRIRGFSPEITSALAPFITVHGSGRVNLNTASREVLAAFPELGPAGADAVIAQRNRGRWFESPADLREVLPARAGPAAFQLRHFTTYPDRVLIVSRGWEPDHPLTHEIQAVLALEGLAEQMPRFRVLYWQERDR